MNILKRTLIFLQVYLDFPLNAVNLLAQCRRLPREGSTGSRRQALPQAELPVTVSSDGGAGVVVFGFVLKQCGEQRQVKDTSNIHEISLEKHLGKVIYQRLECESLN